MPARTSIGAGPARAAAPGPSSTRPPAARRLGLALTVIATAQLMVVLDRTNTQVNST